MNALAAASKQQKSASTTTTTTTADNTSEAALDTNTAAALNDEKTTSQNEAAKSLSTTFDLGEADLAQEWVKEFESNLEEKTNLNDYWTDLQSEWNTLAS